MHASASPIAMQVKTTTIAASARRKPYAEMTTGEREAWNDAMRQCLLICQAEMDGAAADFPLSRAWRAGAERCSEKIADAMEAGPGAVAA
jgi:hypothetical protein